MDFELSLSAEKRRELGLTESDGKKLVLRLIDGIEYSINEMMDELDEGAVTEPHVAGWKAALTWLTNRLYELDDVLTAKADES